MMDMSKIFKLAGSAKVIRIKYQVINKDSIGGWTLHQWWQDCETTFTFKMHVNSGKIIVTTDSPVLFNNGVRPMVFTEEGEVQTEDLSVGTCTFLSTTGSQVNNVVHVEGELVYKHNNSALVKITVSNAGMKADRFRDISGFTTFYLAIGTYIPPTIHKIHHTHDYNKSNNTTNTNNRHNSNDQNSKQSNKTNKNSINTNNRHNSNEQNTEQSNNANKNSINQQLPEENQQRSRLYANVPPKSSNNIIKSDSTTLIVIGIVVIFVILMMRK